ncbi:MAG: DNA alkylation repair protein [Bacteroidia bacterium]
MSHLICRMHPIVSELKSIFQANSNSEKAVWMKGYLRNQFEFYGIKAPERKSLTKQVIKDVGIPKYIDLHEVIQELWEAPERELQYAAMELCDKYKKQYDESFEELLEFMISNKSWWDTVDYIGATLTGNYLKKYPKRIMPIFKEWSFSDDYWLVRVTIIFQLKYKAEVDLDLLADVIKRHANSSEFFIQKAIGWMLRQYSRTNPTWVLEFVSNQKLKPLSKREAIRLIK